MSKADEVIERAEKLGVLGICDAGSIEDIETVLDFVEEFNTKCPPGFMSDEIKFIERNREPVWTLPRDFQNLYFALVSRTAQKLHDTGMSNEGVFGVLDVVLNGEVFTDEVKTAFRDSLKRLP
jgi:hypothetical protein